MKNRKMLLQIWLAVALVLSLVVPPAVAGASATVPQPDEHANGYSVADSSPVALPMALNTSEGNVNPMVAAGYHTVGLEADGTVVAMGSNYNGQCNVGGWTGIDEVATGYYHTVGLNSDGTVVAVGWNDDGRCNVGDWTDIVQVSAGNAQTVGLRDDGTAVAVGWNDSGQCNVEGWDLN